MRVSLLHHTDNPTRAMFSRTRGTTTAHGFKAVYDEPHLFFPKIDRQFRRELETHTPDDFRKTVLEAYDQKVMTEFIMSKALDAKHFSVTRSTHFTFEFETSRSAGRQMLRHVIGAAPEEFSQRYSKVANQEYLETLKKLSEQYFLSFEASESQQTLSQEVLDTLSECFEIPPHLWDVNKLKPHQLHRWLNARIDNLTAYLQDIAEGIPVEDAREHLPNCTLTYIEFTMSFEAIQNFLAKRLCDRAQTPIRMLARQMRKEVLSVIPWAAKYLGIQCTLMHYCPETNPGGCPLHAKNGGTYMSETDLVQLLKTHKRSQK